MTSAVVVTAIVAVAVALALGYSARVRLTRPPIGVMGGGDLAVVLGGVVLVPFLYLRLPPLAVVAVLGLTMASILAFTLGPLLPGRLGTVVAIGLCAIDVAAYAVPVPLAIRLVVNDMVVIIAALGVANLWSQTGLKARHVAWLAGCLAVYDVLATSVAGQTGDLIATLSARPFSPLLAWPAGAGDTALGLGLGDLLLATLFPVVFRKAFGHGPGLLAAGSALAAVALVTLAVGTGLIGGTFPVMVVLGPVIVVEYAVQRRRRPERTVRQALEAEAAVQPSLREVVVVPGTPGPEP